MKLTIDQIRSAASGAAQIFEENGGVRLLRFTKEQYELYMGTGHRIKAPGTPGIRLSFSTDSPTLYLKADTDTGSGRTYFAFDVCVNGERVGSLDNYSHLNPGKNYPGMKCTLGTYEKSFELGEGEKTVTVHLPFSVGVVLQEVSLADGATLTPVRRTKKLLCFGDSITHGYDALHPSNRYPARLADLLDAEEYNKGVGGDRFFPPLARLKDDFTPDYITVAYGTNDWNNVTREEMAGNCRAFYAALRENYPDTPIFAITPVWRADCENIRPCGPFSEAEKIIAEAVADLPNVCVVRGLDLIPHDSALYGDLRLHPSDEGFAHYAKNLYAAMTEYLK